MRLRALLPPLLLAGSAGLSSLFACTAPYMPEEVPAKNGDSADTASVTAEETDAAGMTPTRLDAGRDDGDSKQAPPTCVPGETAQQTRSPSSVVTVTSLQNVNGGTLTSQGIPWTNPEDAKDSDDVAASVQLAAPTRATNFMVLSNFGFAIPEGAVIDGVRYEVERRADQLNAVEDLDVRPLVIGRAVLSVQLAGENTWGNFDGVATYGGLGANFGVNWTPERINDVGFGMSFRAWSVVDASVPTAYVDAVRATVFYTCP